MSYELTITPNRGFVILQTSGAAVDGNIMPTSVTGSKVVSGRLSADWSQAWAEYTVGTSNDDGAIVFNSASLASTTQIVLTPTPATGSGYFIFFNHIQLFGGSNFEDYALFRVNNRTADVSGRTQTLDVTFISSSINSYATNDKVVLSQKDKVNLVPFNYLASPNNSITAIGTLKSINAILQTPASVVWSEMPNDYTVSANSAYNEVTDVRKSPSDTTDVILYYQVTKNGVVHQNFNVILEYVA